MNTTIGESLIKLRARSGMSMSEIARLAGYKGPSSIQRYFAPEYAPDVLDYRFALKLADAMQGAGDPPIDAFEIMKLTAASQEGEGTSYVAKRPELSNKGVIASYEASLAKREYESCKGGEQSVEAIVIHRNEAHTVYDVPAFLEKRDIEGFIMPGRSMYPRVRDGEVAFTEGKRRPAIGDYVMLIVEDDAEEGEQVAVLGELMARSPEFLEVKQPSGANFMVPMSNRLTVRRLMNPEELINSRIAY